MLEIKHTEKFIKELLFKNNYEFINIDKKFVNFIDKEGYKYHIQKFNAVKHIEQQINFYLSRFQSRNIYAIYNINLWLSNNKKTFHLVSNEYYGVNKKLLFHCDNPGCDHDFESSWRSIHSKGAGCIYCAVSSPALSDRNRLSIRYPEISKEWNYNRNEGAPYDYSYASSQRVWWICKNGHEWETPIYSRTNGRNCPTCAGKIVSDINRLSILYAELCKEWDCDKNDKSPYDYSYASHVKVWWKCCCGHSWEATIASRTSGKNCPDCKESHGEKEVQIWLEKHGVYFIHHHGFSDCKNKQLLEYDFYLPGYKLLIEYDGEQHFHPIKHFGGQKKFDKALINDSIKTKYASDNNIELLRISYKDKDNINSILSEHLL